jgi:dihydroflavonol-4-reductase
MTTPTASGRYLCANANVSLREVVDWLVRAGYGARRLPRFPLDSRAGDAVVKLASWMQPRGVGQYLRTHVGRVPRFDNSRIRRELGVTFRPIDDTLRDTMADLERWRHVAR